MIIKAILLKYILKEMLKGNTRRKVCLIKCVAAGIEYKIFWRKQCDDMGGLKKLFVDVWFF